MEIRDWATPEEVKFCNRVRKLMKQMPPTMKLFADGSLKAIDKNCDCETTRFVSFANVGDMANCDGGDPWQ